MRRLVATAVLALAAALGPACGQEYVATGFEVTTFATGLSEPTSLAFAPDGRLFVAQKGGTIRVVQAGVLTSEPFAELEVYDFSECGLLGMALDPDFAETGHVYVLATVSNNEQRIIRLTDRGGVAGDQLVLVDNLPTSGSNHNGGCLRIGPDRHLYFSIGDNGITGNSQDIRTLAGKVSRLRLDGSVPDDNPFVTPTGTPRAVYAMGFRNPFRFCFASDGRLFLMDVGSSGSQRREEINLVRAGMNYGWPGVEGDGTGPEGEFVAPLLAYHDQGASIAGCAVYEADLLAAEYRGNLFHLDFVSQSLFRAVLSGDEIVSHEPFMKGSGGPVDLTVGPDGALYFSELFTGNVMRVAPAGSVPPSDGSDGADTGDDSPTTFGDDEPDPTPPRLCGPLAFIPLAATLGSLAFFRSRREHRLSLVAR